MALEIAKVLLNFDVFESVEVLASGKGGFWDAMNIVVSVNPIGKLGKAAGKIGKAFKWVNRAGDTARVAGKAAEHLFKILPYKEARKLTQGFGGEIAAHHILEGRFARKWGLNPDDIPAVIIPGDMHRGLTGELFSRLHTGVNHTKAGVWRVYEDVYKDFPEWLQEIRRYF